MKPENNTILITGGSSGIGLELARWLAPTNRVLICGRSSTRLEMAQREIPSLDIFPCDLALASERKRLVEWVATRHPACNTLINNAAIVHKTQFHTDPDMEQKAEQEIEVNLLAPIVLTKLFLPLLQKNEQPSIINITTGLVYVPRAVYPIYCGTKAALHAFTRVLREQMKDEKIDIVEVLMPVVDTPWHKGQPPRMAIPAPKAVDEMLAKLHKGEKEIRVGGVKLLYWINRFMPRVAFRLINRL
jgi:uncharacterized oxidoreductase